MADADFELDLGGDYEKKAREAARKTISLIKRMRDLGDSESEIAKKTRKLSDTLDEFARKQRRVAKNQMLLDKLSGKEAARKQAIELEKASRKEEKIRIKEARLQEALRKKNERAATKALKEQERFRKMNRGKGLSSAVKSLGSLAVAYGAVRVAVGAVKFAIGSGINLGKSITNMGIFAEKTRLAFDLLTEGKQGEEAFQASRELATQLGESITDTSDRMKKLLAQQFTLEESKGLIKMLADLKTIGVEGEKADRVLLALTQIRAKGKLQAEEMLQLAEAGVSLQLVYEELGKATGKSRQELEKMQRAGELGPDLALNAVQKAVLKKVGQSEAGAAGERFAKETLQGAFNTFNNSRENFLLGVAEQSQPALKAIAPIMSGLAEVMNNPSVQKGFAEGMNALGEALGRMKPGIIDAFANGMKIAGDIFTKMSKVGSGFFEGFIKGIGPVLAEFADTGLGGNIDAIAQSVKTLGQIIGNTARFTLNLYDVLIKTWNQISRLFNSIASFLNLENADLSIGPNLGIDIGTRFVDGVIRGITGKASHVNETIMSLGRSIRDGLASFLGISSPSRVGMQLGAFFDSGVAAGINNSQASFTAAANTGAAVQSGFSIPAGRSQFQGSPVQKSIAAQSTVNLNLKQHNDFSATTDPNAAIAQMKFKTGDFTVLAMDKVAFSAGFSVG